MTEEPSVVVATLRELVAHQAEEIAWLRGRIEAYEAMRQRQPAAPADPEQGRKRPLVADPRLMRQKTNVPPLPGAKTET